MAQVTLYVPEGVPRGFLKLADPDLVHLVFEPPAEQPHALFGRSDACACTTPHRLALQHDRVTVQRHQHSALGYPVYALPPDCTFRETVLVVAWLLRHRFKAFHTSTADGSLQRTLKSNAGFRREPCGTCCESYLLEGLPVFMLRTMVVSPFGQGPTLESVLQDQVSP